MIAAAAQACTPKKDDASSSSNESALNESVAADGSLVISQVYGGAGLKGAPVNRAYVELFNRTKQPISTKGLAIHYAGPISEFGVAGNLPDATVPPGGYFLVGFTAGQTGLDVRPDAVALPALTVLPVNGKVALVKVLVEDTGDAMAQRMGCGSADAGTCVGNARVLDVVGYGVTTDHEGPATASPPTAVTALFRKGDGCIDTGNNTDDFAVGAPNPRTAASPAHVCEATP